mmetsp:Transcript_11431/g.32449  ORF Transcript_11431/g.32449 Transcript_11431/m.32449 type:complete len:290 (-) Transcript_11431:1991-2860(-)
MARAAASTTSWPRCSLSSAPSMSFTDRWQQAASTGFASSIRACACMFLTPSGLAGSLLPVELTLSPFTPFSIPGSEPDLDLREGSMAFPAETWSSTTYPFSALTVAIWKASLYACASSSCSISFEACPPATRKGLSSSRVAPSSTSSAARRCMRPCQKCSPTAGASARASVQSPTSALRLQYDSMLPAMRCAAAASRMTSSFLALPIPRALTFLRISFSCALLLSTIRTVDTCGICGSWPDRMAPPRPLAIEAMLCARSHSSAGAPGGDSSPRSMLKRCRSVDADATEA